MIPGISVALKTAELLWVTVFSKQKSEGEDHVKRDFGDILTGIDVISEEMQGTWMTLRCIAGTALCQITGAFWWMISLLRNTQLHYFLMLRPLLIKHDYKVCFFFFFWNTHPPWKVGFVKCPLKCKAQWLNGTQKKGHSQCVELVP